MIKLFTYGTLTDPSVQMKILGRITNAVYNTLKGYEKSEMVIEGETFPLIIQKKLSTVSGKVIEVTKNELKKIDQYETDVYKRNKVILENGLSAWVYLKK